MCLANWVVVWLAGSDDASDPDLQVLLSRRARLIHCYLVALLLIPTLRASAGFLLILHAISIMGINVPATESSGSDFDTIHPI